MRSDGQYDTIPPTAEKTQQRRKENQAAMGELTKDDAAKVAEYRKRELGKYEKPSVTADIVAVRPAYDEPKDGEWRSDPEFSLDILLIKRGVWPHEGCWALPGGFLRPNETIEECAKRELREETGVEARNVIPTGVFSKPGRDMRAWILSNAFVCLLGMGEGREAMGGDDAKEAKWLRIKMPTMGEGEFNLPFYDGKKRLFSVRGKYKEGLFGGTVTKIEKNPLAFDHAEIIAQSFLRMLAYDKKELVFLFLPEKFTLSNYIDVYQYLTRYSLERDPIDRDNIPNFRRQLTSTSDPLLEVCEGEWADLGGRAHAPAKLYRRRH